MTPLYFEDLHVGQTFTSAAATMTRSRIIAFAEEFDPQPQHLNEDLARTSMFGTLIASGWHTGAQTMRLQLDAMMDRIPGGAMGAQVESMAWTRPVLPDDQIRAVLEVMALRPSKSRPDRGLVTLKTTTLNQRDEPVMVMTAAVLLPRRPAEPAIANL